MLKNNAKGLVKWKISSQVATNDVKGSTTIHEAPIRW